MPSSPIPPARRRPSRSGAPVVHHHHHPSRSTSISSGWITLAVGLGVAFIPWFGLILLLVVSLPCALAAFIMGIVGATRGRPIAGISLILCSVASFILAAFISTGFAMSSLWELYKHHRAP